MTGPGALAGLISIIAEQGGNIVSIHHAQGEGDVPVMMARVEIELETRGKEHAGGIEGAVTEAGYRMDRAY